MLRLSDRSVGCRRRSFRLAAIDVLKAGVRVSKRNIDPNAPNFTSMLGKHQEVMQLLNDSGLECEIADAAEGIYQG